MTIRDEPWPAGTPCYLDLMTPDVRAVSPFYAAVLGWEVGDPDPAFGGYATASVRGHVVAGLGPLGPGQQPAWMIHLATDDAAAHAEQVTAHGGSVLAPVMDIADIGRLAVVSDPTGAAFGLWQAGTAVGSALVNERGSLVWEDLRSSDPDTARTFYRELFGWTYDAVPMAPADYTTFSLGGGPLGGLGGFMGETGGATPSHWLPYLGVADTDVAVSATKEHGGSVHGEPWDTPYGRMAALADPAGASFCVISVPADGIPGSS